MAIEGVVEDVVEEVATNLEEAAAVTRRINPQAVGYFAGGLALGLVAGFYFGHRWNREKIKAEAFKESEAEVEKIREVYQQRIVAAREKPSVEEVIEERGYSTRETESVERPLKAPVPVIEPPLTLPGTVTYGESKSKNEGWNFPEELAGRTSEAPYVIHQDEFNGDDNGYAHVTYTYYSEDDVLTDEDDTPLPHADLIVGQDNLKFGHGTDDPDVVFVRNDRIEVEMEICRLPASYAEEVLGLHRDTEN